MSLCSIHSTSIQNWTLHATQIVQRFLIVTSSTVTHTTRDCCPWTSERKKCFLSCFFPRSMVWLFYACGTGHPSKSPTSEKCIFSPHCFNRLWFICFLRKELPAVPRALVKATQHESVCDAYPQSNRLLQFFNNRTNFANPHPHSKCTSVCVCVTATCLVLTVFFPIRRRPTFHARQPKTMANAQSFALDAKPRRNTVKRLR